MPFAAAVEMQGAAKWLFATLSASADLAALVGGRIYDSLAPQDASLPYVVYNFVAGDAVAASGGAGRILDDSYWVVQGISESGSYTEADSIAKACDGAISGASGTATIGSSTYTVQGVLGGEPVRYVESSQGRRICHSGRRYRVLIHA